MSEQVPFKHVWLRKLIGAVPGFCSWCGHHVHAVYLLTRISSKDGNKYEDEVCEKHAKKWKPLQEGVQMSLDLENNGMSLVETGEE